MPTSLPGGDRLTALTVGPQLLKNRSGRGHAVCEPDGMTPEEARLLEQVEATYAQLDSWFHRTSSAVEQPQKGSELHADDQPYPHAPISEMARMSLAIGTEHLRMVRILTDKRQLFPTATFTALRGALVGAAQAFWVLSSDDSEVRRSRGWTVLAEQLKELGKFYGEVNRIDPGTVDADQLAWHSERTAQLAALRGDRPPTLSQTEMIRLALESAFPNDPDKQRSGRLLWRMMSSDAHVLGWGLAQRASVQTVPSKAAPLAVLAAPGDLEHMAEAFLCAYELLRRGWAMFDRRCEA